RQAKAPPGKGELRDLLVEASEEAAAAIQKKLKSVRTSFELLVETFLEKNLVQYEEVATVVTKIAVLAVPEPYRTMGKKLGLDDLIAKNLVAKLIPKEALDAINGLFHLLTAQLKPIIKSAEDLLDQVLDKVEAPLTEVLLAGLRDWVIQPSAKSGTGLSRLPSAAALLSLLQASRGEALPDEARQEMEARIGSDFADVRIHRDTPAQRASELLHANAFALGQQVYFGSGSYVPESPGGRRLLAHELAHVVQQRQGRVARIDPAAPRA